MKRIILSAIVALGLAPHSALAIDNQGTLQAVLDSELNSWITDSLVIEALRSQNSVHSRLSAADIASMDEEWRSEIGTKDAPLQTRMLAKPISKYFMRKQKSLDGIVSEVILMDAKGLNVAMSNTTSDYWQGDEAKFTETFNKGLGAVHFSEIELDESTGVYLVQVSTTIADPDTGEPIGAATFGINVGLLE
ncbi:PDC sensor domain-containing protein [Falsihalocynthiibacter sp. SS001]|uniref:PDC sensor domain-containing protein n=1 Tax=Falsihalocynthiibacter sp. SS001 TaxID=3349698 RepID=UPI0036D3FC88